MASRLVAPQQSRVNGEGDVGAAADKQKKIGAGVDANNRRVLRDIGNQIPCRPLTSHAQSLVNDPAAAATENNKMVYANVDKVAVGKIVAAPKAVPKKKENVKPKPEEVIVISPDTKEREAEKKAESKKKDAQARKAIHTLTSVLSARSKAACGLPNKPKKEIIDIDAADANNDFAGVEYVEDIYKFYKEVEEESTPRNYMASQPEINEKMRAILVDWLIDVHLKFELAPETLYLTINIIDRFLSVKTVSRRELQLVGISATLIASKYEEIWAPEVNDLVCISDRAYTHEQIRLMEKAMLGKLEWHLTVPTHYVFLARFIKASVSDKELEHMVYFLAELGMMHYDTITFCPSMVAASAVYSARCTFNKTPCWTETLEHHTGFTEQQLKECASLLVYLHSKAPENKLQSVRRKYSSTERGSVALFSPANSLLPE